MNIRIMDERFKDFGVTKACGQVNAQPSYFGVVSASTMNHEPDNV
jgi:hypothetical protein